MCQNMLHVQLRHDVDTDKTGQKNQYLCAQLLHTDTPLQTRREGQRSDGHITRERAPHHVRDKSVMSG